MTGMNHISFLKFFGHDSDRAKKITIYEWKISTLSCECEDDVCVCACEWENYDHENEILNDDAIIMLNVLKGSFLHFILLIFIECVLESCLWSNGIRKLVKVVWSNLNLIWKWII